MPTRLPTTPAVGSGWPATGGGAGLSRPKPKSPRFFFSVGADGGGLHSSTGGALTSGTRNDPERAAPLGGLPHGSSAVVLAGARGDHVLGAGGATGGGATHVVSFSGAGEDGGGVHDDAGVGDDAGGEPQGSSEVAGVVGSALGGALQRSAVTVGSGGVPH